MTFHTPFGTRYLDEKKLTKTDPDALDVAATDLNRADADLAWMPVEDVPLELQGYEAGLCKALEREMPRRLLRGRHRALVQDGATTELEGAQWSLRSADIALWNVGVALLTVSYGVTVNRGRSWGDLGEAATKCREPLSHRSEEWVRRALETLSAYATRHEWLDDWTAHPDAASFWSEALWTYEWFSVLTPRHWTMREVDLAARSLVEDGGTCAGAAKARRSRIRIALTACSVTRSTGDADDDRRDAQRLRNHIEAHTACWGSAITLDLFVWEKLVELQFDTQDTGELDEAAEMLLKLADKVRFFLVTLGGVRPHLNVQDAALWECLDEGWRFPEVRNALMERLAAVRELQTEKASQLSNRRLRRLNRVGLALTIVGVVASITSIASFVLALVTG